MQDDSPTHEDANDNGINSARINRWTMWVLAILLLMVIYLLSTGPVVLMAMYLSRSSPEYMALTSRMMGIVYFPLIWLTENSETAAEIINAYVNWWIQFAL